MSVAVGRDLEATGRTVGRWLAGRLGVGDVVVSDLSTPRAGYSNETIFLRASWSPPDGPRRADDLVLRIQPTGHQLFVRPDALFQARMMTSLGRHPGTPVPRVWFTEADPDVLGAPFFLMARVAGRIPGDVPSWHKKGWTVELTPDRRARLYDNGLAALAALHRIDWRADFGFLDRPGPGTALDRYLDDLGRWHESCAPDLRYEADTLAQGVDHLLRNRPRDPAASIVWGDARVGNICYGDDLSVQAMFDWETATVGPPGIDLGWWLMFEEFLSESQGLPRLEGVPGRAATIARYEELHGAPVEDVDYYQLLAATVLSLVNSKLAELLVAGGTVSEEIAAQYPLRTLVMVRRWLEQS